MPGVAPSAQARAVTLKSDAFPLSPPYGTHAGHAPSIPSGSDTAQAVPSMRAGGRTMLALASCHRFHAWPATDHIHAPATRGR